MSSDCSGCYSTPGVFPSLLLLTVWLRLTNVWGNKCCHQLETESNLKKNFLQENFNFSHSTCICIYRKLNQRGLYGFKTYRLLNLHINSYTTLRRRKSSSIECDTSACYSIYITTKYTLLHSTRLL